jgi:hypothetical protein
MSALNAAQVQELQNSTPTNWSVFDAGLQDKSNFNTNRYEGDEKLHVRFYMRPHLDILKSQEARRAIYADREYVQIMIPGDKLNIIDRPADLIDRNRFSAYYAKFKAGTEQIVGTPINALPFLSQSQVEEYKFINTKTVEQLSELADSWATQIMGGLEHKRLAKQWLEDSKGVDALRAEFTKKEQETAAQIKALQDQLDALKPKAKVA